MSATSKFPSFKAEIMFLEEQVTLAMTMGDFDLFEKSALGIDAVHAKSLDFPTGEVVQTARGGIGANEGRQWDMTIPFGSDRTPAFNQITSASEFLAGHAYMMKFMVGRGLDLDSPRWTNGNITGSAIASAIRDGSVDILKVVMDLGASPNGVIDPSTKLSVRWDPLKILLSPPANPGMLIGEKLKVLLDAGASLDVLRERNKETTPLAIAASSGRWEAVLCLLQLGENPLERSPANPKKNALNEAIDRLTPSKQMELDAAVTAWLAARDAAAAIDKVMQAAAPAKNIGARP